MHWSRWEMTGLGGGGPEEMARRGQVLADQLAGKVDVCVSNGVELKTVSVHTDAPPGMLFYPLLI